jgi:asparaginyl-tRNA synthetase
MDIEPYTDYLELREYGTCPHGGFGLGFERLIKFVGGIPNIRDCIFYPRAFDAKK